MEITKAVEVIIEPVAVEDIEVDVDTGLLQRGQFHRKVDTVLPAAAEAKLKWVQVGRPAAIKLCLVKLDAGKDITLVPVKAERSISVLQYLKIVLAEPAIQSTCLVFPQHGDIVASYDLAAQ